MIDVVCSDMVVLKNEKNMPSNCAIQLGPLMSGILICVFVRGSDTLVHEKMTFFFSSWPKNSVVILWSPVVRIAIMPNQVERFRFDVLAKRRRIRVGWQMVSDVFYQPFASWAPGVVLQPSLKIMADRFVIVVGITKLK